MLNSILVQNSKVFEKQLEQPLGYIDIDYDVVDPELGNANGNTPWGVSTRQTIMTNEKAIANAYRLWLQSNKTDYIREPGFGGIFSSQLNDKFTFDPSSEESIVAYIKAETAEKWPEITIVDIKVTCEYEKRNWKIRLKIMDSVTRLLSDVSSDVPLSS